MIFELDEPSALARISYVDGDSSILYTAAW